jgi:choline kinase
MCPFAFNALAAERALYAVPVEGLPWIEIDFAEDLLRAREQVWPAILARQPAAARDRVTATSPTAASSN